MITFNHCLGISKPQRCNYEHQATNLETQEASIENRVIAARCLSGLAKLLSVSDEQSPDEAIKHKSDVHSRSSSGSSSTQHTVIPASRALSRQQFTQVSDKPLLIGKMLLAESAIHSTINESCLALTNFELEESARKQLALAKAKEAVTKLNGLKMLQDKATLAKQQQQQQQQQQTSFESKLNQRLLTSNVSVADLSLIVNANLAIQMRNNGLFADAIDVYTKLMQTTTQSLSNSSSVSNSSVELTARFGLCIGNLNVNLNEQKRALKYYRLTYDRVSSRLSKNLRIKLMHNISQTLFLMHKQDDDNLSNADALTEIESSLVHLTTDNVTLKTACNANHYQFVASLVACQYLQRNLIAMKATFEDFFCSIKQSKYFVNCRFVSKKLRANNSIVTSNKQSTKHENDILQAVVNFRETQVLNATMTCVQLIANLTKFKDKFINETNWSSIILPLSANKEFKYLQVNLRLSFALKQLAAGNVDSTMQIIDQLTSDSTKSLLELLANNLDSTKKDKISDKSITLFATNKTEDDNFNSISNFSSSLATNLSAICYAKNELINAKELALLSLDLNSSNAHCWNNLANIEFLNAINNKDNITNMDNDSNKENQTSSDYANMLYDSIESYSHALSKSNNFVEINNNLCLLSRHLNKLQDIHSIERNTNLLVNQIHKLQSINIHFLLDNQNIIDPIIKVQLLKNDNLPLANINLTSSSLIFVKQSDGSLLNWFGPEISVLISKQAEINNDRQQALQLASDAHKLCPWHLQILEFLIAVCTRNSQFDLAIKYIETCINNRPNQEIWFKMLAECYRRRGQYKQALDVYKLAVKSFPRSTTCLKSLVLLSKETGDKSKYYEEKLDVLLKQLKKT